MQTTIRKWGNSFAVRIPKAFITETKISDGEKIDISIKNLNIVLSKPKLSLDNLLNKINKNNLHKEIISGGPIGNEIW